MPTATENQLRLANSEMNSRIVLLEATVHEQTSACEALGDSEKRYRRLFESAKDGILILDADTGKVVDANPFLLNLLGYSCDELVGQHIWELGPFKDIAASKDAFKELQGREYIRYEDLPLETHDGRPVSVEFVSNVYTVDNRDVIQCNIRDITARKVTEKALRASESKIRSILDNVGIGVALISPQMEVLELNRRMREWFPAANPAQRPTCYRVFNVPPREGECDACPTQMTLKDGEVHEGTTQTPGQGGKVRNYRVVSSPIFDASGAVTAAIEMVEDITEKLSLESQLRQAQKMEAVGHLAGGMAHDYNNMLSVILGYSELALGKIGPAHALHDDLQEIHSAALRSAGITRQLLAFARKQTIMPQVLDLNETVENMLKVLRRLIGEDIDLAWLPEVGECPVKMDPGQVDQMLANLCVNARDAIADVGKITIETGLAAFDESYCAEHAGTVLGDYVLLAVSDDGCGMDNDVLSQVFEPFYTSKQVGKGTGLGLSTVYGIVKQNNGFINVYSEIGQGTTFRIYLPRHESPISESRREPAKEIPLGNGETVLLVEDEPAIRTMSKTMLERLGYHVLIADTPPEAIRVAKKHSKNIRLLVTDVIMPDMNGRDLAERLQSLSPTMNTLFMSGYTSDVIAHRGVLAEGVNFLQKPFSIRDFAISVSKALAGESKPSTEE